MAKGWFEVDKAGLRSLVAGKPKSFVLRELFQNAWDEPGVTEVTVRTGKHGRDVAIIVIDDAPEGFVNLSHAFTLFADTRKRTNPEQRGRFNLGEKTILALCHYAKIVTTKGGVHFLSNGQRKGLREKRQRGSQVELVLPMTSEEYAEMLDEVRRYLPPAGITTKIDGRILSQREPLKRIPARLETEIAHENNGEKILRRVQRDTTIEVYEVCPSEKGTLYEMGLPICETDDQYHYNVMQKVPLALDRETVPAAYLRAVRAHVLNAMIDQVETEDASQNWVRDACADKRIAPEALKQVVEKRFGDKVVAFTPGDTRGYDEAIRHGYRVVCPAELSKEEWGKIRETELIQSTRERFPIDFIAVDEIPQEEWTPEQKRTAEFVKFLAEETLGTIITVRICDSAKVDAVAEYNRLTHWLEFNRAKIQNSAWKQPAQSPMLELLIHEIAHERGGHFEDSYHKALCEIAAKLPRISREHPEWNW